MVGSKFGVGQLFKGMGWNSVLVMGHGVREHWCRSFFSSSNPHVLE